MRVFRKWEFWRQENFKKWPQEYFEIKNGNFEINFENGDFEKVVRNLNHILYGFFNVLYGFFNVLYGFFNVLYCFFNVLYGFFNILYGLVHTMNHLLCE